MDDLVIKPRLVAGQPPVVIAEMGGKLNATTATLFDKFATECARRGVSRVVLDIPDLRHMGSTGFDRAIQFAEQCADGGGGVAVVNASPKIQVVLGTLGMGGLFRLHPNVQSALATWRAGATPTAASAKAVYTSTRS